MTVPLVTSLAPKIERYIGDALGMGNLYQYECIESWRNAGFDVFSINAEDEMIEVQRAFPNVEVIKANRDGRARFRKPLIPISELVHSLKIIGGKVGGIINSDIMLKAPQSFASRVSTLSESGLSYMKRTEVFHPHADKGLLYSFGIDAFFFNVDVASGLELDPFTIGVPWWDYFLPMLFLTKGYALHEIISPIACHLRHPVKWDKNLWYEFHHEMRSRIEKDLLDEISIQAHRVNPLYLYSMSQGSYYFRHYSKSSKGYDLGRSDQLRDADVENHIVAYGYFVLDFLSSMSKKIDLATDV